MSARVQQSYLEPENDPAVDLVNLLRSRLGHLEVADLADNVIKVIVQVWQVPGGREAVARALEQGSGASHAS